MSGPTATVFIACEHGAGHGETGYVAPEHATAQADAPLRTVPETTRP